MQVFVILNNVGMMINVCVNPKKWFIWNLSNCECECDKSGDVGEYLDYENCRCRKKLVDKLTEECTKNIDEVKIASDNKHKNKGSSCTLHVVLFSILFRINIGIVTSFVNYKYMNHNKENVSKYDCLSSNKLLITCLKRH